MKKLSLKFRKILAYLPKKLRTKIYRLLILLPPSIPENIRFKFADTKEEFEQAFSILHNSYVDAKLMEPHPSSMRITPYHALPWAYTLIAIDTDCSKVVGTLTIIRNSHFGLPSDELIDLKKFSNKDSYCAEISALAIEKEYRGKILFPLLKFMYESCIEVLNIEKLIAILAIDGLSQELYESLLFFKKIENFTYTDYAFSNYRPVVAEGLDLRWAREKYLEQYSNAPDHRNIHKFFTSLKFDNFEFPSKNENQMYYSTMDLELFNYFFCQVTDCLNKMTKKQINLLKEIYHGLPHQEIINQHIHKNTAELYK